MPTLSSIILPETSFNPEPTRLDNLNYVNLIVGPNNVGKSRFFRALARRVNGKSSAFIPNFPNLEYLTFTFLDTKCKEAFAANLPMYHEISHSLKLAIGSQKCLPIDGTSEEAKDYHKAVTNLVAQLERVDSRNQKPIMDLKAKALQVGRNYLKWLEQNELKAMTVPIGLKSLPLLRTARDPGLTLGKLLTSTYQEMPGTFYWTGENLHTLLSELSQREEAKRLKIKDWEIELGKIFEEPVIVSAGKEGEQDKEEKPVIRVKLGKTERKLYEMGDGVEQILLCSALLFFTPWCQFKQMNAEKTVFNLLLLEEPDANLHASLQRRFLKWMAYMAKLQDVQVFCSTHSNHLIDAASESPEVSIYKLRQEQEQVQVEQITRGVRDVVSELGLRISSVGLVNKTLWVEGPSDVRYVRQLLSLAGCQKIEDLDYSYVMYGGNLIYNWMDIDISVLCGKALFIADNDKNKQSKHLRCKEKFGDYYITLPDECSEMENLLGHAVIEAFVKSRGDAIITNVTLTSTEPVGTYLEQNTKNRLKWSGQSGTLSATRKRELSENIQQLIPEVSFLTPSAHALSSKLIAFLNKD